MLQFAILGLATGGAYALTALGIVVVYRGTGVINFGQGAVSIAGAYGFWEAQTHHAPTAVAILVGLAAGALLGCLSYILVMRPLRGASDVSQLVATLGILLSVQGAASLHYPKEAQTVLPFLGNVTFDVAGAVVTLETVVIAGVTIVLAAALSILFAKTRIGTVAAALRDNPKAAAVVGISPHPTAILAWSLGGALGALAAVLLLPLTALSPGLVTTFAIPALAVALVGKFRSMWIASLAGLLVGVLQSVLIGQNIDPSLVNSIPFAIIVIALVVGGQTNLGRSAVSNIRLPALGAGRLSRSGVGVIAAIVVAAFVFLDSTWMDALTTTCIAGIIGLSFVVVTGYAGQVSFASLPLAGLSSLVVSRTAASWHAPFLLTILLGVVAAAGAGLIVGLAGIRVRGINFAIATLALALVIQNALLSSVPLTGGTTGIQVPPAELFGFSVDSGSHVKRYAIVCVVCLALAGAVTANIRRGRSGRRYIAIRANERGATALGISVAGAKLSAFAISAGLAGLAGALFTYRGRVAGFSNFTLFGSIQALALSMISGVGWVAGGIASGGVTTGGLSSRLWLPVADVIDDYLPLAAGLFLLQVLLTQPEGFVPALVHQVRALIGIATRGRLSKGTESILPEPSGSVRREFEVGDEVMSCRGVQVRYGRSVAVDQFDLSLKQGKVVGLIGPNGAGKTTLIDALTGFVKPTAGEILFDGKNVVSDSPAKRARLGLARTFQNLELFEDLTVFENIVTGADARDRSAYLTDMVLPGRSALTDHSASMLRSLHLESFRDARVSDLSQGHRRVVAICRAMASDPKVVCLDEPVAGLSVTERADVGVTIRRLCDEWGVAVLLVEHNIDLVVGICDELVVLDHGRIIAAGPTQTVIKDPIVREAYLGSAHPVGAEVREPV